MNGEGEKTRTARTEWASEIWRQWVKVDAFDEVLIIIYVYTCCKDWKKSKRELGSNKWTWERVPRSPLDQEYDCLIKTTFSWHVAELIWAIGLLDSPLSPLCILHSILFFCYTLFYYSTNKFLLFKLLFKVRSLKITMK